MTLKTLADVHKLISHVPKKRRVLSTWPHVEKTLRECAAGDDPVNISVALQIVLQGERVLVSDARLNFECGAGHPTAYRL
jgi:hypothetical protein